MQVFHGLRSVDHAATRCDDRLLGFHPRVDAILHIEKSVQSLFFDDLAQTLTFLFLNQQMLLSQAVLYLSVPARYLSVSYLL